MSFVYPQNTVPSSDDTTWPNIWFCYPSCFAPHGGINFIYQLCGIFEESWNVKARVLSYHPYTFCNPPSLSKYWIKSPSEQFYDIPDVRTGDIVVTPEIYIHRASFPNKKVKFAIFIQN